MRTEIDYEQLFLDIANNISVIGQANDREVIEKIDIFINNKPEYIMKAVTRDGSNSLLDLAIKHNRFQIVQHLLEATLEIDSGGEVSHHRLFSSVNEPNLLYNSIIAGREDMARMLSDRGVDLGLSSYFRRAIQDSLIDRAQFRNLLGMGANLNLPDENGITVMDIIKEDEHRCNLYGMFKEYSRELEALLLHKTKLNSRTVNIMMDYIGYGNVGESQEDKKTRMENLEILEQLDIDRDLALQMQEEEDRRYQKERDEINNDKLLAMSLQEQENKRSRDAKRSQMDQQDVLDEVDNEDPSQYFSDQLRMIELAEQGDENALRELGYDFEGGDDKKIEDRKLAKDSKESEEIILSYDDEESQFIESSESESEEELEVILDSQQEAVDNLSVRERRYNNLMARLGRGSSNSFVHPGRRVREASFSASTVFNPTPPPTVNNNNRTRIDFTGNTNSGMADSAVAGNIGNFTPAAPPRRRSNRFLSPALNRRRRYSQRLSNNEGGFPSFGSHLTPYALEPGGGVDSGNSATPARRPRYRPSHLSSMSSSQSIADNRSDEQLPNIRARTSSNESSLPYVAADAKNRFNRQHQPIPRRTRVNISGPRVRVLNRGQGSFNSALVNSNDGQVDRKDRDR